MKLVIKETTVTETHVELTITDGADVENADCYLIVRAPRSDLDPDTQYPNRKHLVAIQAAALRSLRDAIDDQIGAL